MKGIKTKLSLPSLLIAAVLINACAAAKQASDTGMRQEFVDIGQFIPSIRLDIRYYGSDNFAGSRIDGYAAPKCLLSRKAAEALEQVQQELANHGQALKIFDCYRPQRAVDHFVRWAKDLQDRRMKSRYYPTVDKKNLFKDGYIAEKSGHSRGSTVDLTIINATSGQELDMGTPFDFFDPLSHSANNEISRIQQQNRAALISLMERHGFKNLKEEWWHFTLKDEAYPDRYFDFVVE